MAERVQVREIDDGEDQARDVIRNFNADGLASLHPKYAGGRPRSGNLPGGPSAPGIRSLRRRRSSTPRQ